MIKKSKLKTWLQQDIVQRDKLLLILGSFEGPCQIREMYDRAAEVGFLIPGKWNPSKRPKKDEWNGYQVA